MTWTAIVVVVAVALTVINTLTRGDVGYAVVIVWAFGGIIIKQMAIKAIVTAGSLGIFIIFLFLILKLRFKFP